MGETERGSSDMMQTLQSSIRSSSCSAMKQPLASSHQLDVNRLSNSHSNAPVRHFKQSFGVEGGNRAGIRPSHPSQIPPISPYSMIPNSCQASQALSFQNFGQGSSHSWLLSPQPSFVNLDPLPPLSPSTNGECSSMSSDQVSKDVIMKEKETGAQIMPAKSTFLGGNYGFHGGESLPPRKAHRRSISDSSFGFSAMMENSPVLYPLDDLTRAQRKESIGVAGRGLVKSEYLWNVDNLKNAEGMCEQKLDGEVIDGLFLNYMNLDNDDKSSRSNTKLGNGHCESGRTGETSDDETESSINESGNGMATQEASDVIIKREGMKRSATQDIARHCRSVSMDSFVGNLHFGEESLKPPPSPCPLPRKRSPSTSLDKTGNGEFSGEELKKIMANENLAQMAVVDPKRVKRILANRQSAARSKERKMRYISELEHKVQTLQSEATTLSAQVTQLQHDSASLTSQNIELRFRLQAMEQQAQLRSALNETLQGEVQRLKLGLKLNSHSSNSLVSSQMFQIPDQKQPDNISPIPKEELSD